MRLFGINIPDNKRVVIALTSVHGIGSTAASKIMEVAKIDLAKRTKDLSQEELNRIKQVVDKDFKIEGELRQEKRQNINRLKQIKAYRGSRHSRHLPSRGQSTRRNSRTVRGNIRKTMGSGRRKLTLK